MHPWGDAGRPGQNRGPAILRAVLSSLTGPVLRGSREKVSGRFLKIFEVFHGALTCISCVALPGAAQSLVH
ncbi:hypothetical protein GCM10022223_61020 [Kineosporia mesophila]|uniref:Uncharacterized protein n=1 Tax=Kineosporia mesophila TaxID=566012 RepID=A0ABP7ALA7_9ACTN